MHTLDGFRLIDDVEELWPVIKFLESGFRWDEKRSLKILNRLKEQASTAPKAAVYCSDNDIKIAILLFDQTNTTDGIGKVINLSAWYAKETHRGISVLFAKTLTTSLKNYTITNYAPIPAAGKVFKSLGYEDMPVKLESIGIQKQFPFIKIILREKYFTFMSPFRIPIDLTKDRKDTTTNCNYQISSVKKMGIKLTTLRIFVETKKPYISLRWLIKTIFFHAVVRINIYSKNETNPTESLWLAKNIRSERYISPHNSELSV